MATILPIKELKNTAKISELCRASNEPIFITKNGYGDMVIMSIAKYEDTMSKLDIYAKLEVAEQQIAKGQVDDAENTLRRLRGA